MLPSILGTTVATERPSSNVELEAPKNTPTKKKEKCKLFPRIRWDVRLRSWIWMEDMPCEGGDLKSRNLGIKFSSSPPLVASLVNGI
jgi:hypothetical protein